MFKCADDESTSADCEDDQDPSRVSEKLSNPSSAMQYFPVSGIRINAVMLITKLLISYDGS